MRKGSKDKPGWNWSCCCTIIASEAAGHRTGTRRRRQCRQNASFATSCRYKDFCAKVEVLPCERTPDIGGKRGRLGREEWLLLVKIICYCRAGNNNRMILEKAVASTGSICGDIEKGRQGADISFLTRWAWFYVATHQNRVDNGVFVLFMKWLVWTAKWVLRWL